MLDNLDGKQARKTGSSSFLGMIFDHQCDALTTFIFITGMGFIVGLNDPFYFAMAWAMTLFPFYLYTLRAYYTDRLDLAILNGASEGTIFACAWMSFTGFYGKTLELLILILFYFYRSRLLVCYLSIN